MRQSVMDFKFPVRTHHGPRGQRAAEIEQACSEFTAKFGRRSDNPINLPPEIELKEIKRLSLRYKISEKFLRVIIYGKNIKKL